MAQTGLLLLHGALYESSGFADLLGELKKRDLEGITFDLPGHGRAPSLSEEFSIRLFGDHVIGELDRRGVEKAVIFGFSMGGYIGLWLARHHPERVASLVTLGTKMEWTPEGAAREVTMLDPEMIDRKVPAFGQTLRQRHGEERYSEVLQKTATMMKNLGSDPEVADHDLEQIEQPVRMMVGDRDHMVTIEETAGAYRHLQNGELAVLPATGHPLEKVDTLMLARVIDAHYQRNSSDT